MKYSNWLVALALAAAALLLPPAARLNTYLGSAFLTAETYASMLGILVSALLMARRDPAHSRRWALVVGLAPLVETSVRMLRTGPGNLWPIAIALALFIGLVPSFFGERLARTLRPRTPVSRGRMVRPNVGDVPDIMILPPVLVGGVLVVGVLIHYALWTVNLLPTVLARVLGVAVFISAGVLAHFAQLAMKRAGTNILPTRPTLALATDGPYRFSRNPLYVAAIGVYLGVALWVNGLAPLLLMLPMSWLLHWGIVLREERYLEAKFGEAYRLYQARVRRWL